MLWGNESLNSEPMKSCVWRDARWTALRSRQRNTYPAPSPNRFPSWSNNLNRSGVFLRTAFYVLLIPIVWSSLKESPSRINMTRLRLSVLCVQPSTHPSASHRGYSKRFVSRSSSRLTKQRRYWSITPWHVASSLMFAPASSDWAGCWVGCWAAVFGVWTKNSTALSGCWTTRNTPAWFRSVATCFQHDATRVSPRCLGCCWCCASTMQICLRFVCACM